MLKSISIKNYRNIKDISLDFSESETLLIGQNGQGKTSILEAIFFLSIGKAYRAKHWSEAINFDEDYSIIEGETFIPAKTGIGNYGNLENADIKTKTDTEISLGGELEINKTLKTKDYQLKTIFIGFQKNPRKQINFKINGSKKKLIDFIGNFSAVLFSPEDLRIITDSPQNRRDFLDSLLIRIDKNFAYELNEYQKIIKQRNALLKKINEGSLKKEQLELWDEKLAEKAIGILEKRIKLIEKLKPKLEYFYKAISKKGKRMEIEYETNLEEISEEKIREKLQERIERDIILGATSVGPHRDDLKFYLDGNEMKEFASQGEIRTGILSLKYSEIEILKEKTGDITLLLDDVFSELDEERQKSLIELSKNYQTIITSTHMPEGLKGEKIIKIKDGKID